MKIQLIQPRLGERRNRNGRDKMAFPLGLAAIATYVKRHNPGADIELPNPDFEKNIEDKLDGDVIGIQPNILNMSRELIDTLHGRGQIVILGGVHASQAVADLVQDKSIDYVCLGDGEDVMLQLSHGVKPDDIAGLQSATKIGVFQRIPLRNLPIVDRTLFDQERYMRNSARFYETYMPSRPFRRMTVVYSNKGCAWRAKTGGCYFCGRLYKDLDTRTPSQMWEEARQLVKEWRADFLWDVSDSITSDREWLQAMVDQKPADINPYWFAYGRVSELNRPGIIKNLAAMNVYQMLTGVETGSNEMAKAITKGNTNNATLKAAKKAKEYGVNLFPSFVVGLPGETEESLQMTYQLAQRIVEINDCEEISVSMLVPMPGSKSYTDLRAAYRADTGQELPIMTDGEQYQRLWFKYHCKTDFDNAVSYIYKMMDLTPVRTTFASPYLTIDPRMPTWNQISAEARDKLFDGPCKES